MHSKPVRNDKSIHSFRNPIYPFLAKDSASATAAAAVAAAAAIAAHQVSDNTLNALFESYKDDHEDAILSEGIERLCNDLSYRPDDFAILVLAWQLNASQMCRFTKAEFIQGLRSMGADSIVGIRRRLEEIVQLLRATRCTGDQFKQLYRFTFLFGLESGYRIVSLDMAIILWRLVFSVHPPDILERWLFFLEQHPDIRGVPKDTWNMFLNFAETVDITAYDDTEAWPSLFDDFVEWETDRTNQNVEPTKAALIADAVQMDSLVGVQNVL